LKAFPVNCIAEIYEELGFISEQSFRLASVEYYKMTVSSVKVKS